MENRMDDNFAVKCDKIDKAKNNMIDKNKPEVCSNGCHKYSKSFDEVVQALSKHRDAAVTLKEINLVLKKKMSWYRDQLGQMQSQIDKLEQDNDSEHELVIKLLNEKKILVDKVNASKEEVEEMRILKEELEEEIEELTQNQQTSDKSSMMAQNSKLQKKVNICENVIEELKKNVSETSKLNKKLKYTLKTSEVIDRKKNDDLKEQLIHKSEEIVKLEETIMKVNKHVRDQEEEIDQIKNELERKEPHMTSSSCGSLADEIEFANFKVEKIKLQAEVKSMKVKVQKFEKSKMIRVDQLKKLEELSNSRKDDMLKLKSSLDNVRQKIKTKCKYGWNCRRGRICKFDHFYLHSKDNRSKVSKVITTHFVCEICKHDFKCKSLLEEHLAICFNSREQLLKVSKTSEEKDSGNKANYPCEECNKKFSTRKKLRKHRKYSHKVECEFLSKIKFLEHVKKEHTEEKDEENEFLEKKSRNYAEIQFVPVSAQQCSHICELGIPAKSSLFFLL